MSLHQITSCPICHSTGLKNSRRIKDYSISKETFTIQVCIQCGFNITNPRPADADLGKYYHSEDYVSHSSTKKGLINSLYHRVQKVNLRSKYRKVKKHVPRGTWADFGAGTGAFLSYTKSQNEEAIGFEPEKNARDLAKQNGVEIRPLKEFSNHKEPLACITLWHVLEHVADLNEQLKEFHTKLQTDGILAIAVPNHHAFDSKYYKEYWAALDVPRHLWHFTEQDVISLLKNNGFTHIKTYPMVFDSYYISMLSEKYKNGSALFGTIIGALSNVYARLSSYPYSSQIYIFKK